MNMHRELIVQPHIYFEVHTYLDVSYYGVYTYQC